MGRGLPYGSRCLDAGPAVRSAEPQLKRGVAAVDDDLFWLDADPVDDTNFALESDFAFLWAIKASPPEAELPDLPGKRLPSALILPD